MNNNDSELMRRFQSLRGDIQHPAFNSSSSLSTPILTNKNQQQKKNKKKCRGNRKRQRFVAKLRKQGFNKEEIEKLLKEYNNINQDQIPEQSTTIPDINVELLIAKDNQETLENKSVQKSTTVKRKREKQPQGLITSMSQMSISNLPKKRQRSKTMDKIQEQTNITQAKSDYKPKYLKVPDQIFKQMLLKSLSGTENLIQSLDTSEKLQFVRTYAHLLNNVFYLKLEKDYWEHYYNVCMTESIWTSPLSKEITKRNNLCRFQFKTKTQLDKHRKLIINRLQEAENKLNQHKQQQQSIYRSIDMNRLSTVIPAFVRQGQSKLSKEFERKKSIVQFDANDHRLVKTFYDMKPSEDQIHSTKIIWQATRDKIQAEEQVAILKQRIYTKRLPSSFNILDHSIDSTEEMLKQPALNQDKRATISFRRLKTIAQFKYDLMAIAITTAEETVRSHEKIIADEKKKLIDATTHGQVPLPKSLVQLMNTIAARQTNLVQRSQVILKQKLSVFDDAPMVIEMAGAVGAIV